MRHLSVDEQVACRLVWRWKDLGKPHGNVPDVDASTLHALYRKLSVLEGKYSIAVSKVERILAELEDLEDDVARQQGDEAKRWIDMSLGQLRDAIGVVEELIVMHQSGQEKA